MKIRLMDIACTRSGDKGDSSNIGVVFEYNDVYNWAVDNITADVVKKYLNGIAKAAVIRYELPNLLALNFIIKESLEGGGSDSLLHDAQGKTHGQLLLLLELDVPETFCEYLYSFNDEYPTLNDGLRGMLFIEKAVESHEKGNIWVNLNSN